MKRALKPLFFTLFFTIVFIAMLECLPLAVPLVINIEKGIGRKLISPELETFVFPFKQYVLIGKLRADELREEKIEQYGKNKLFYRRKPGYISKQRYETFPEISRIVDETGFLNDNVGWYDKNERIPIFISGDSIIQGVGMSSVVESLKKSGFPIWNLSMGSYSPVQKVQAVKEFALSKKPKLIIIEFCAGNDVSEAIEDSLCERYGYDYNGRFHMKTIYELISKTAPYNDFYVKDKSIRGFLRNNSVTYNILKSLKYSLKNLSYFKIVFHENSEPEKSFLQIPVSHPAYAHLPIKENKRLLWAQEGMKMTLDEYVKLLSAINLKTTKLVILYNPTTYEIYRHVLPEERIDAVSDSISNFQRETLKEFCNTHQIIFWDITEQLQNISAAGRKISGYIDSVHWTKDGREEVFAILRRLVQKYYIDSAI